VSASPRGHSRADLSPPGESVCFDENQRKLVIHALSEAEDRTSGYYCIPPRHWQHLRYDLITRSDLAWTPLPELALAKVQRIEQVNVMQRRQLEFFRIQLNDPRILGAAKRDRLEPILYPFLVYILTHEMVHLVRLSTILDETEEQPFSAELEEERVERISRQILSQAGSDFFKPVFDRFRAATFVEGCDMESEPRPPVSGAACLCT
jgi:hypothetical protein